MQPGQHRLGLRPQKHGYISTNLLCTNLVAEACCSMLRRNRLIQQDLTKQAGKRTRTWPRAVNHIESSALRAIAMRINSPYSYIWEIVGVDLKGAYHETLQVSASERSYTQSSRLVTELDREAELKPYFASRPPKIQQRIIEASKKIVNTVPPQRTRATLTIYFVQSSH